MEASLNLPELETILTAAREKEKREQKFMAAIQGIDLDKNKEPEEDPVQRIKRKLAAKRAGRSEEELLLDGMGIDVAVE